MKTSVLTACLCLLATVLIVRSEDTAASPQSTVMTSHDNDEHSSHSSSDAGHSVDHSADHGANHSEGSTAGSNQSDNATTEVPEEKPTSDKGAASTAEKESPSAQGSTDSAITFTAAAAPMIAMSMLTLMLA